MSNWGELPCPKCQALNFIVFGDRLQIETECKECGELVTFVRDPWAHDAFLERIKEHRKYDPTIPGGR